MNEKRAFVNSRYNGNETRENLLLVKGLDAGCCFHTRFESNRHHDMHLTTACCIDRRKKSSDIRRCFLLAWKLIVSLVVTTKSRTKILYADNIQRPWLAVSSHGFLSRYIYCLKGSSFP